VDGKYARLKGRASSSAVGVTQKGRRVLEVVLSEDALILEAHS